MIRGWKCEAVGDITVVIGGGSPISMTYGNEWPDVRNAGGCSSAHVGFVSIWNYGELDSGEHTAVAYDNGVEFARSTFTVVRASEESGYLQDVTAECTVPDFPDVGTNARFEWNTGTQHLELAEVGEDVEVPVSTQFDGEWDFVFAADGVSEIGGERCDCLPKIDESAWTFLVTIENGSAALDGFDCVTEEPGPFFVLVSPSGQLESSYGAWRGADFLARGSFDGFLFDDGTGYGRWLHIFGCGGPWSAERREDS